MKGVVVFAILLAACSVQSSPIEDIPKDVVENNEDSPRFIQFADIGDALHDVDLEDVDHELLEEITRNPANNAYYLFTRRNRVVAQTLTMNNANSVRNSNFNPNNPTVVVVHGWQSNRYTEPNPSVRSAYLDKSDVNVIIMSWSRLALSTYATAARGVPAVGRALGQFLVWLSSTTGARLEDMHLVGFSLGAHLVGNAGRAAGGRIARVTGLDPAGPLWTAGSERLTANDGVYVEAIHTDGGSLSGLGIGSAIAQVDFFPNGGNSQPGCYTSLCNHNRAWELFASTVTNNHLQGRRCTSSLQVTLNTCNGVSLRMGNDDLRKTGTRGSYRLDTGRRYPY